MGKKFISLVLGILLAISIIGCTTITGYHKKVTVEKDGQGKIVKTTVEEEIHQPNLYKKVSEFRYLDE